MPSFVNFSCDKEIAVDGGQWPFFKFYFNWAIWPSLADRPFVNGYTITSTIVATTAREPILEAGTHPSTFAGIVRPYILAL